MLKSIITFLRRLIGIEKDIERIVRPMTKIVTELERYEAAQVAKAGRRDADAELLRAAADRKVAEANELNVVAAQAKVQRARFAELLG